MKITAFDLASRFIGTKEMVGLVSNPMILAMLRLDNDWPKDDSVPWCSAFPNYINWLLRLPRSKRLNARSWLEVGRPIYIEEAVCGFDIVVLKRGDNPAAGHVGYFAALEGEDTIHILGGNQKDSVCVLPFPRSDLIGVRRIYEDEGL